VDSADWLGDADRVASLGRRLAGAGVPADRLALYRRTLHPEILCRVTAWSPERPIEIFDREHGLDLSLGFPGSPLDHAIADGRPGQLSGQEIDRSVGRWADPLRSLGLYILLLVPIQPGMALAVGSRCRGGFSESDKITIDRFVGGLAKSAKRQKGFSQ
jgi:adenylate cyclase